jgi:hypothetical protein
MTVSYGSIKASARAGTVSAPVVLPLRVTVKAPVSAVLSPVWEINTDAKVVTTYSLLVKCFDVVTLTCGEGDGCGFLACKLRPIAEVGVAQHVSDELLVSNKIAGA